MFRDSSNFDLLFTKIQSNGALIRNQTYYETFFCIVSLNKKGDLTKVRFFSPTHQPPHVPSVDEPKGELGGEHFRSLTWRATSKGSLRVFIWVRMLSTEHK